MSLLLRLYFDATFVGHRDEGAPRLGGQASNLIAGCVALLLGSTSLTSTARGTPPPGNEGMIQKRITSFFVRSSDAERQTESERRAERDAEAKRLREVERLAQRQRDLEASGLANGVGNSFLEGLLAGTPAWLEKHRLETARIEAEERQMLTRVLPAVMVPCEHEVLAARERPPVPTSGPRRTLHNVHNSQSQPERSSSRKHLWWPSSDSTQRP
jgi:hypothetical protein